MLERADRTDRKTLDNNELIQVVASSGFSLNKGLSGVLSLAGSKNLVSVILIEGFS